MKDVRTFTLNDEDNGVRFVVHIPEYIFFSNNREDFGRVVKFLLGEAMNRILIEVNSKQTRGFEND